MKTNTTMHPARGINDLSRRAGVGFTPRLLRGLSWLLLTVMLSQGMGYPLAAATGHKGARRSRPAARGPAAGMPSRAAQAVETFNVFGPQRFDRSAGAPVTEAAQFSLPPGAGAPFVLTVRNGAADGSARAASATVKLNGVEIFRQSDFNRNVGSLERQVELRPDNALEVRLTSAPGSHVTVTVTSTRTGLEPAELVSAEPSRATQGQSVVVELRGENTHWLAGQTRASFGGEVSVGGAAPGEPGPVHVTDATTAFAELVISPTAALAPRNVRVVTPARGGEEESVSLANAFTVVSASAPGAASARVSTLAGVAGSSGFADGQGTAARFSNPTGVAVGADESVYVADAGNHRVRVVRAQAGAGGATSYVVLTLAGSGTAGFTDGAGARAQFNNPQGLAVGADGTVYVADTDNHRVRRVSPDGVVTTAAGDGAPGFVNGPGAQARFKAPRGVAVDSLGNVYVADAGNAAVRRIGSDGSVTTVAGDGTVGENDSPGARFDGVSGISCDGTNVFVYLADTGNHRIRRLDSSNTVVTVAGAERGFADGAATQARFAEPSGIALDGAGKLVIADAVNSLVRLVDIMLSAGGSAQAAATLAGTGERGSADGAGNVASFVTPRGVAVAASSAVYVADTGNSTLRRILLPPSITSLSPQRARPGQQVAVLGERFDARAPERNTVRFTRSVEAGGGQTSARVVNATRTALTVEVPSDAAGGPVTVETEGGAATSPVDFELAPLAPPSIADFNPKSGPVGTTVTITGANLTTDGSDPAVTFLGAGGARLPALVTAAVEGEVRALVPNGAITGHLDLTNAGGKASSPAPFTVESEQDFQLTIAPSAATAVQGGTTTYVVSVTSQQPSFSQLAALSAEGLPAGVAAVFEPPQITAGARSTLSVALGSSGLAPGTYPFTIRGAASADGRALTRTTNATLNVLAAGQTTLSGRVMSTEDQPIMGAIVSLDGRTATTDAAGSFILSGVLAGTARPLMIDGRTASAPNRTYPIILEPADIVSGRANVIPYIYYLPPIDTQYEVEVVPGQNTAAGNPRVPGLQMTIPAGANLRNRDGTPVARVSITPLAIDRTPTPLPANVSTNLVYTSQPGGALTDIAIPVVYPNLAGADPGTRVELYAFDHDFVRWYVYGFGRVSADGRSIAPEIDPATGRLYGLRDFSWHFPNAGPDGNPGGDDKRDCEDSSTGTNPVNYATGIKIETSTDLSIGGARGGLELTRTYTSDLAQSCDFCPFGRGATHNYAVRLSGSFRPGGAGRVVMPDEVAGRLFSYARQDADGALVFVTTATTDQLGDVVRRLPDGTFEYRYADGELMRFDGGGRLTGKVDRNGNTTTLTYTGANLTSVTDAVGRSLDLDYDSSGRVTRVTDPLLRVWRYTYETGALTTVTDPLGNVTRYAYVVGGRLASVTDPLGNTAKQIAYDAQGRVVSQRFADGAVERYEYTLSGALVTSVTITDPLGRKSVKRFNAAGYVLSATDPLGQTAQFSRDLTTGLMTAVSGPCGCTEGTREYDARGNVTAETDRAGRTVRREFDPNFPNISRLIDHRGRVTTFTYDARGNLLSITNPQGQTTTTAVDPHGQVTAITDALGNTTRTEYDQYGFVSAVVDALGNRREMEHDAAGRMTAAADPLGRRATAAHDALGRVVRSTDAGAVTTRYAYDPNGNLLRVTDALGRTWAAAFDPANRQVSAVDPLGRKVLRRYNLAGEMVSVTSPSGRAVRYTYDERGQVRTVTDPLQGVIRFAYDSVGNVTAVTDALGRTTTYTYDELYRPSGGRNPLGQKASIAYDAAGLVIETTDPKGRRASYAYDPFDRLAGVTYPDAAVTYSYDQLNRIARIDDTQGGAVSWAYDAAGRILSETTPAGAVSYTYNGAGQRTSMKAGDRPLVTYGYDGAGRIQTISRGPEDFSYAYDALSRPSSLTRPNAIVTTYGYDAVGRLERFRHTGGAGQALEDRSYTYTADDQIASINSLLPGTLLPAAKSSGAADAANRVAQSGAASYVFDELGQTVSKTEAAGTTHYSWDERGRLARATLPDGQTVSYGYDAHGRRASRTANGVTTTFLYDGDDVVYDRDSRGAGVDYLNGPGVDNKLRQSDGAGPAFYFLKDHLGSTSALTDGGGGIVETQQYDAFGAGGGSRFTRYGFTGREHDEATGLIFYRARWYDPEQGRFLNEDPIGFDGGMNFYAYTNNDPLNLIDPMGTSWSTFWGGFKDGFGGSAWKAALAGAGATLLFSVLTACTAGTFWGVALSAVTTFLTAFGMASFAAQITQDLYNLFTSDLCPDDFHYALGRFLGDLVGGMAGGWAGGKFGGKLGAEYAARYCFVAGTLVHTADGPKRIEDVRAGDVVLSSDEGLEDPASERPRGQNVETTFARTAAEVIEVRAGGQTVTATTEHPFRVWGRGWVPADELRPGDRLVTKDGGAVAVESLRRREGQFRVYNFEVADTHTYFVSPLGLLVHNGCGRRGNAATRQHLDDVRDDYLKNNPTHRHIRGGRNRSTGEPLPEEYLPPMAGSGKGASYPDLTFEAPDGSRIRINTVDTDKFGNMTPREANNFNRIFEQTNGGTIIAIPKP